MGTYSKLKKQIVGKPETHFSEYRDANGQLVDPSTPFVHIYNPNGDEVSSGAPTKESTGVYFYTLTLSTATSSTIEGMYQIWWEGIINGAYVTMDEPHYFYVQFVPWALSTSDEIIYSVRRLVGDMNPDNYRISTQDMYYFLQDAVESVNAEIGYNNSITVSTRGVTFAYEPLSHEKALYKLKTLLLVKESVLSDALYDGGIVVVGDIKVDVTGIIRARSEDLKRLQEKYDKLIRDIKMNVLTGYDIDTHVTGILMNSYYDVYRAVE